jgi:hypothetical protein
MGGWEKEKLNAESSSTKEIVTSQKLEDFFVRYMFENVISVKKEEGDEDEVIEMREDYDNIRAIVL